MRERVGDLVGPPARAAWVMTFHSACGRILRREAQRLGYRSNFTIYDSADQVRLVEALSRGTRARPEALHAARHPLPDLEREEHSSSAPRSTPSASRASTTRPSPRSTTSTRSASSPRTPSTSTTCSSSPSTCSSASPRRARSGRTRSATSSSTSTRTRTTPSTACCSCWPRSIGTSSPWAIRTSRSTRFRGADIRNVLEFEHDFPGAHTIALEQNYRSTSTILDAANGVISHNRERKEKNLWSELGDGDPVRVVEVEDEHAEARYVAAEIALLVEEGFSGSEIAVFYRTNAQSRVLEDVLVRQGIAYQVIGGPRFYERAEIKDLVAYLQVLDNPYDAVSLLRIANRPRRGVGDTTLARLQTWADQREISLWEATAEAEKAGVGAAPQKAVKAFRATIESLMSAAQELEVAGADRGGARPQRVPRVARGRADDRGAGPHREPRRSSSRVAREWTRAGRGPSLSAFLQEISLYSDQDAIRGDGVARHAHDPPQREGPRVPRRLPDRDGGGDLPALALDRGAGDRGGAAALLRRHDAGEGAADAAARVVADALRRRAPQPAVALPRRAARAQVERERLRPASWSGYGAPRQSQVAPREDVPALSTGDSVRHATLGEGVVVRIEPGGVVTVRFADDGSERKLDARLRAAREAVASRPMFDVRPSADQDEFGRAIGAIGQYFGPPAERGAARALRPDPAARPHARRVRGRPDRRRRGRVPVRAVGAGRRAALRGRDRVGVHPTHRRRGVLRSMMDAQLRDIHERGEPIAALWASEETIYGRFGYGLASWCGEMKVPHEWDAFAEPLERRGHGAVRHARGGARAFPADLRSGAAERPGMTSTERRVVGGPRSLRLPEFEAEAHPSRFVAARARRRAAGLRDLPDALAVRGRSAGVAARVREALGVDAAGDGGDLALPARRRLDGRRRGAARCRSTIRSSCSSRAAAAGSYG